MNNYEERNSDIFSCTMYIGWKMKYLSQHECKTSHNEVYTCSRKKKIKIMLLDSLDKSILITRGRKASIPTYFLYEELSHREKQPS